MAEYKIFYPGLQKSLKHWRRQVIDSLPYVAKNFPPFDSLEDLFYYCKNKFTYINDPEITELFMTVPTLLHHNEHGVSGGGDCDDASILCMAPMLLNGFEAGIVLAGHKPERASHIYTYGIENGEKKILDLTTSKFNKEGGTGPYEYRQYVPFQISKDKLDMFLQLADNGVSSFGKSKRKIKMPKKKKLRIRNLTPKEQSHGIYLPSKGLTLPLDRADKMPIRTVKSIMLSDGYTVDQLSDYLSNRKERKAYKKAKKKIKLEKQQASVEKKQSKSELRRAKADKKRSKGQAAIDKQAARKVRAGRQGGSGWTDLIKGAGGAATKILNRGNNTDAEDTEYEDITNQGYQGYDQDNQDSDQDYNPDEVQPEEVEAEEVPQEDDQDLQDGFNNKDIAFGVGILLMGLFVERSKII